MFFILSKPNCPWCDKAKDILTEKELDFEVWEPNGDLKKVAKMLNIKTVPQIFKEGVRIGGYEDLVSYLEKLKIDDFLLDRG
jgi:glutaredoxin